MLLTRASLATSLIRDMALLKESLSTWALSSNNHFHFSAMDRAKEAQQNYSLKASRD